MSPKKGPTTLFSGPRMATPWHWASTSNTCYIVSLNRSQLQKIPVIRRYITCDGHGAYFKYTVPFPVGFLWTNLHMPQCRTTSDELECSFTVFTWRIPLGIFLLPRHPPDCCFQEPCLQVTIHNSKATVDCERRAGSCEVWPMLASFGPVAIEKMTITKYHINALIAIQHNQPRT